MAERALTENEVWAALRDCYDPEVPCNIVDLGLVYGVEVVPDPEAPGAGIVGVPARHRVRIELRHLCGFGSLRRSHGKAFHRKATVRPLGRRVCLLPNKHAAQERVSCVGDRMEYERYKPKSPRPAGMGAFFDYGTAMEQVHAPKIATPKRKRHPAAPQPEQAAEQRWDGEGGTST